MKSLTGGRREIKRLGERVRDKAREGEKRRRRKRSSEAEKGRRGTRGERER